MTTTEFSTTYGPYAVVTGASSGIGEAFSGLLAKRGLNLFLVARRGDRLARLADTLQHECGVQVQTLAADLVKASEVQRVVEASADLDVGLLVSNAGFSLKGAFSSVDANNMINMLMVNCQAPLLLAHGFIPHLKARGKGGLIFTSSVEALIGCPYSTAYSASKALVKSLGEGLWGELTPSGIDVLTLCPGATDTEALANSGADASVMPNVMSAAAVAELALDNIKNGPVFVSSEHYRRLFDQLVAMPRDQALATMAAQLQRHL